MFSLNISRRCGCIPSCLAAEDVARAWLDWILPHVTTLSQPLSNASANRNSNLRICCGNTAQEGGGGGGGGKRREGEEERDKGKRGRKKKEEREREGGKRRWRKHRANVIQNCMLASVPCSRQ